MNTKIVFTGGGTAGHVTPNLALIEAVKAEGWLIDYVGSQDGVESQMIKAINIPYHAISSGKLRRYFSWRNFLDPFLVLAGIGQAYFILRRIKADVVFSKGGFVAFPVVFAAWLNRIPVLAHESDLSPGLANRLSFPFVNKICVTFAVARSHFKNQHKVEVTGTPVRSQLFRGDKARGLALCGFKADKPCLLVMGGSLGSARLNRVVREILPTLSAHYQVIHLCGKGKVDESLQGNEGYCQFEYANEELPDLYAATDMVVSRAGANSLYELLVLAKPHVLVPLSAKVTRGDQIQNAAYFARQHISVVVDDDSLSAQDLIAAIEEVGDRKEEIIASIKALGIQSATSQILALIKEQLRVESPEIA